MVTYGLMYLVHLFIMVVTLCSRALYNVCHSEISPASQLETSFRHERFDHFKDRLKL